MRKAAWEQYADGYLRSRTLSPASSRAGMKKTSSTRAPATINISGRGRPPAQQHPQGGYDNMLDTARRKLPVWHRYWSVKRRILGLDKLHAYDVFAPLEQGRAEDHASRRAST